jgi:hypothetical protein
VKVAILVSLARQVEGEMVYLNVLKCHEKPEKLDEYLRTNELPMTGTFGGVGCIIEYGVFRNIEVETEASATPLEHGSTTQSS